jgi:hypothetical protein
MAGSLFMDSTAILSAKVAVVDSVQVGTYARYSRYNNGPRILPWGTPALILESSVYSRTNVSYIKF